MCGNFKLDETFGGWVVNATTYACTGDDGKEDFPSMVRDKKGLSCGVLVNSSSHGNLKRHVDAAPTKSTYIKSEHTQASPEMN